MATPTFELAKTIAAFGGLVLGIANLGLSLYKDYFRKGRLRVDVRTAEVRAVEDGVFDIQVDLDFSAYRGSAFIKHIELIHSHEFFDPAPDKKVDRKAVYKLIDYPGFSLLSEAAEGFETKVRELFAGSIKTSNLQVEEGAHRFLTVAERVTLARSMDGYWDWPLRNWQLRVLYSNGELNETFDFSVHKGTPYRYFCSG